VGSWPLRPRSPGANQGLVCPCLRGESQNIENLGLAETELISMGVDWQHGSLSRLVTRAVCV